mgnify:CR=1 FL=1
MSGNENFPSISIEKIKFKNHDDVFNFGYISKMVNIF